jgi:hypothetical protein
MNHLLSITFAKIEVELEFKPRRKELDKIVMPRLANKMAYHEKGKDVIETDSPSFLGGNRNRLAQWHIV